MVRSALILVLLTALFSVHAVEPESYPLDRYRVLWQTNAFKQPDISYRYRQSSRQVQKPKQSDEWNVAGVFSFGQKPGAMLINSKNGKVEQITETETSASGFRLLKVHTTAAGQLPKVDVSFDGKKMTLVGKVIRATPVVAGSSGPRKPSVTSR